MFELLEAFLFDCIIDPLSNLAESLTKSKSWLRYIGFGLILAVIAFSLIWLALYYFPL
ncbi:MAG: hypothetical protein IJX69_05985 [Oscillospiraceae bacterium]|nr:hypothetical protein [Oscillospiraceae bacterium]